MAKRNIRCDYDAALHVEVFNRRRINAGGTPGIVPGTWSLSDCPHQIPKMLAEADAIEPMSGRIGAMPAQVIHPQELKNCHYVAVTQPLDYPANPPPFHKKKTGQSILDWLTNVAYWMTYPDAPIQINAQQHPQWVHVWLRIQKCVGNKLGMLGEPLPFPPAKLKPRYVKFKRPGGECWTQWKNGQLFKCCESEWVPGIGTAISCEKLNPPRPTGPPSGVRRLARIVGRYGKRSRYDRRYGAVGAANPVAFQPGSLSMSYRPSSSRSLLRPRFQVDYQGSVGQTGVRAGQARGAPLRHVVAKCPPGTTKRRSDGACIPDGMVGARLASGSPVHRAGVCTHDPKTGHSCCMRGIWWTCSDFAGNHYIPGVDTQAAIDRAAGVGLADRRAAQQSRVAELRARGHGAAGCTSSADCIAGQVCVDGKCKGGIQDPFLTAQVARVRGKPRSKPRSKPLVIPLKDPFEVKRRRRGAFGRARR